MNKKRSFDIDLSRLSTYRDEIYGAAVLWIMLFHGELVEITYFKDAEVPVLKFFGFFLRYGNMGVDIFLFMSGICLYFSFVKNNDPVHFMKKRIARLFPPLLLIYGPFCIFQHIQGQLPIVGIFFSLTTLRFWFTDDFANWFMSLILVCYIFYPYIYGILYRKKDGVLLRTLILMAISAAVTYMIMMEAPETYAHIEVALTRFPVFILGCGCGRLVYEKKKLPAWLWPVLVMAFFTSFYVFYHKMIHGMWKRYCFMAGSIPLTIFLAYILPLTGPIICRFLRFLGSITLELYITHLMLRLLYSQGYLFPYVPGSIIRWLEILAISVVISYIASLIISLIKKGITAAGLILIN